MKKLGAKFRQLLDKLITDKNVSKLIEKLRHDRDRQN